MNACFYTWQTDCMFLYMTKCMHAYTHDYPNVYHTHDYPNAFSYT
jgi:hypothetical protein